MTSLTFDVVGLPAPQGSKKGFYNPHTKRVQMTESSNKVKPWRQDVAAAAREQADADGWVTPTGPLEVLLVCFMPRPKYHYRTGARANELKPNAPVWVDKKPDADKVVRSTLDALTTSAVIRDDAQVARLTVEQRYADGAVGARITIRALDSVPLVVEGEATAGGTDTPARAEALF